MAPPIFAVLILLGAVPVSEPNHVLIFGLGFTGRAIARALLSAPRTGSVVGTCRDESAAEQRAREGFSTVLFDADGLRADGRAALARATHVISTIAPSNGEDPVIALAGEQLRALSSSGALRWAGYLSTTSVYGDHGGRWVDELSPTLAPAGSASHARLGVEQEWLRLGDGPGACAVAVFRLAGIYGPGRSALDTFLRQGSEPESLSAADGNPVSRVHVDDIAGAVTLAADARCSGLYNVADLRPAPRAEVMRFCERQLLAHDLLVPAASRALRDERGAPVPRSSDGARSRRRAVESKRVNGDKLRRELGYAFAFPDYEAGLAQVYNGR